MQRLMLLFVLLGISQPGRSQGYVCAIGGGSENYNSWSDAPYRWIVQKSDSQSIIVLAATPQDTWIPRYFQSLGADTAWNLTIGSIAVANDSATWRAITQCRAVFIKGGDQWDYVSMWGGTLTEEAIRYVYQSGGVVAGTSAGAAVLGEVVFDARYASATSRTALRNPRSTDLSLTTDFLSLTPGCFFDTHFYERARFGRLLAIMAKYELDSGKKLLGIGLESETALCISQDGIGEVMGAGAVVFYYPSSQTRIVANANRPLVYTDIQTDALVAGYRYDVNLHRVSYVPPTAAAPGPGTNESIVNNITLFGDAFPSPSDLDQLIISAGGTGGSYVIVTSASGTSAGQRLADTLSGRGVTSPTLIALDYGSANDLSNATAVGNATGLIFAENYAEEFPSFIDSSSLVGRALRGAVNSGVALAFVQQDAKLAGSTIAFRTELEELAAYRGKLTMGTGVMALRNLVVIPSIFQSDVYDWNRAAALPWVMAKTDGKTGIYLDEGTSATIGADGIIRSHGSSPLVVLDARNATAVGYSTYRHSGSAGPRQSAAIIGATIHSIDGDVAFDAATGGIVTSVADRQSGDAGLPRTPTISGFPNPFNPVTTIRFTVPPPAGSDLNGIGRQADRVSVTLKVFDMQGREVRLLMHREMLPGTYTARFDGSRLASGIYVARLQCGKNICTEKLILTK